MAAAHVRCSALSTALMYKLLMKVWAGCFGLSVHTLPLGLHCAVRKYMQT